MTSSRWPHWLGASSICRPSIHPCNGITWCYRDVREPKIARAFFALLCIALLLWCSAIAPSTAHAELALPALVFFWLAVLTLSLLCVSNGDSAAQPLSFLTVHISRPPPLA